MSCNGLGPAAEHGGYVDHVYRGPSLKLGFAGRSTTAAFITEWDEGRYNNFALSL